MPSKPLATATPLVEDTPPAGSTPTPELEAVPTPSPPLALYRVTCAMLGADPSFRKGDLVALVQDEARTALVLQRGAVARVDEPDPEIVLESDAQLQRFLRLGVLQPATDAEPAEIAGEPDPHEYHDPLLR